MSFDVSSIKKGTKIDSAILYLYAKNCTAIQSTQFTNVKKNIFPFSAAWGWFTITWNNCPAYSSTPIASAGTNQVNVWEVYNLTDYINGIVNNNQSNNGFIIKSSVESGVVGVSFESPYSENAKNKPRLVINYENTVDLKIPNPVLREIRVSNEYAITLFNIQGKVLKSFTIKDLKLLNTIAPIGFTIAKINNQNIKILKR